MLIFRLRKIFLLALIVGSAIIPLTFIRLDEPTPRLLLFKMLAKTGSLAGAVLMFWQMLLGFRGAVSRLIPDLIWVLGLHKKIGTWITVLVILHPIFITLYYLDKHETNLFAITQFSSFDIFVVLGIISLVLLFLIVVSSLYRLSFVNYTTWFSIHLTSYILLPLVFIHSFPIGMTINETALGYLWRGFAAILIIFYLFRVAVRLGMFVKKHQVTKVTKEAPDVTRITMRPKSGKVNPKTGQFVFLRRGITGSARPFTVSHYNRQTGEISVTVKALGKITTALQEVRPEETMFIEGPYGIFTHAALQNNRPLVMIAGGIGITPFIRLFDELAYEPGIELHLFYGNKYTHEIIYREEIDNVEHVNVVHVMSHDSDYPGEKGFITVDMIKKYLNRELKEYEFLICGPPVMTTKLIESLLLENISADQIHYERFSY